MNKGHKILNSNSLMAPKKSSKNKKKVVKEEEEEDKVEEIENNTIEKEEEESVEDDSWMFNDSSKVGKTLEERSKVIEQQEDEFFADLRETQSSKTFVDLEAQSFDPEEVKLQCEEIVRVLCDFRRLSDKTLSRNDYKEKLKRELMRLYGYNEFLIEQIMELVRMDEVIDFIEANEQRRPVVIRTNTLMTRRDDLERMLRNRGVNLMPLHNDWSKKVGLIVYESNIALGATPEYLSGYYMLQSPSSFLPVIAMEPKPGMKILDMCAAPGGKTTHIGQLMKKKGILIANDYNKSRCNALVANIHRLGVTNAVVTNYDGEAFPHMMQDFDMVMCDAPCSGTGVISRDPTIKATKSRIEIRQLSEKQKKLILAAYDSIAKKGGRVCYCTCSVLVEENEEVVDYLLKHRKGLCKVVKPNIDPGFDEELTKGIKSYKEKHFHPSIENCRRVYPHKLNMDGFFFAIIDVLPGPRGEIIIDEEERAAKEANAQKQKEQQKKFKKFSKKFGGKK